MKKPLLGIALAVAALAGSVAAAQRPQPQIVEVYKDPSCGCCANWVKHLEANGFKTKVTETADMDAVKIKLNVPRRVQSCHTATIDGFVLEGHVPAADLKRLLKDRPAVIGLAVPGMPVGSPGMEVGNTVHPYEVLAFDKRGEMKVYASYGR